MARHRRRSYRARRAPLRKFVWARSFGTLDRLTLGADLLANFQSEYGAQLLGATVVRIRGWVAPTTISAAADGTQFAGTYGFIIDQDRTDYTLVNNAELALEQREHDDWLWYFPFSLQNYANTGTGELPVTLTPNAQACPWAIDVKSSRKIEELGQTLQIWQATPDSNPDYGGIGFHLSIGLKLP